jgi:hypothetical protein
VTDAKAIAVNGSFVSEGSIWFPWSGRWVADLDYGNTGVSAGQVTIVGPGLSLVGTVRPDNTGLWIGVPRIRVVGGFGGWQKALPAKHYHSDAGVSTRLILGDAAKEAGEQLEILDDVPRSLPAVDYVRAAGPASKTLRYTGKTWWMRPDGTTLLGTRPQTPTKSPYDLLTYDPHSGVAMLAGDSLSELLPGGILADKRLPSPRLIIDTEVAIKGDGLRIRCATQGVPS